MAGRVVRALLSASLMGSSTSFTVNHQLSHMPRGHSAHLGGKGGLGAPGLEEARRVAADNAKTKKKVAGFAERRMDAIIRTRKAKAARFLEEQAKKLGVPEMELLASRITQINGTSNYRSVRSELQKVAEGGVRGLQAFCAEQQNKTNFDVAHIQGRQKQAAANLGSLAMKADAKSKEAANLQAAIATSQQQLAVLTRQHAAEVNRTSVKHSTAGKKKQKKGSLVKMPKISKEKIDLNATIAMAKKENAAAEALLKKLDSQMQEAARAAAYAHQERHLEAAVNAKQDILKGKEKQLAKMKATLVERAHAYQDLQHDLATLQQSKRQLDQKCPATRSPKQAHQEEEEVKALRSAFKFLSGGEA